MNASQTAEIEQWINICRLVYNLALETKMYAWKSYGISLSKYDIQKQLPGLKKEFPWMQAVHSQTLQDVVERMDRSYLNFFRGSGYPKWAKKGIFNSFAFKQGVAIDNNHLVVPKLGRTAR